MVKPHFFAYSRSSKEYAGWASFKSMSGICQERDTGTFVQVTNLETESALLFPWDIKPPVF